MVFYGLPLSEIESYRERVNAITVDDIQRVARQYLRPDRLSVVLVGNAAAFTDALKGVGFTTFEVVHLSDLDLDGRGLPPGPTPRREHCCRALARRRPEIGRCQPA